MLILTPFIIFSHTWALVAFTVTMVTISVYELLKCVGLLKRPTVAIASFAVALEAQILVRLLETDRFLTVMLLSYLAYTVMLMTFAVFSKGTVKLPDVCQIAVMTVYVSFGFAALVLLRDMNASYGIVIFLLAFLIPWVCDAMAYFVGVFFGKHKMIPDVSPKKTVEGAIGGIVGTVVAAAIFGLIMQFGFGKQPNYVLLLSVALVGGFVSQWGDLIASLLKREYGVKDYGWMFPGHGGMMDRFDSLFSVSIFIYIVMRISEAFPLFVNW
jgi:phosphatidate cytidylyltransferase